MSRRTDPPVFFVDRSLGAVDVPRALRAAGAKVEVHDDHFGQDTEDAEWLGDVGARGWIVLTKDARIQRHPLEMKALMAAGVGAYILTTVGVTGTEMAEILVKALPKMIRQVETRQRPFVATVSRSGEITIKVGGARRGGVRRD